MEQPDLDEYRMRHRQAYVERKRQNEEGAKKAAEEDAQLILKEGEERLKIEQDDFQFACNLALGESQDNKSNEGSFVDGKPRQQQFESDAECIRPPDGSFQERLIEIPLPTPLLAPSWQKRRPEHVETHPSQHHTKGYGTEASRPHASGNKNGFTIPPDTIRGTNTASWARRELNGACSENVGRASPLVMSDTRDLNCKSSRTLRQMESPSGANSLRPLWSEDRSRVASPSAGMKSLEAEMITSDETLAGAIKHCDKTRAIPPTSGYPTSLPQSYDTPSALTGKASDERSQDVGNSAMPKQHRRHNCPRAHGERKSRQIALNGRSPLLPVVEPAKSGEIRQVDQTAPTPVAATSSPVSTGYLVQVSDTIRHSPTTHNVRSNWPHNRRNDADNQPLTSKDRAAVLCHTLPSDGSAKRFPASTVSPFRSNTSYGTGSYSVPGGAIILTAETTINGQARSVKERLPTSIAQVSQAAVDSSQFHDQAERAMPRITYRPYSISNGSMSFDSRLRSGRGHHSNWSNSLYHGERTGDADVIVGRNFSGGGNNDACRIMPRIECHSLARQLQRQHEAIPDWTAKSSTACREGFNESEAPKMSKTVGNLVHVTSVSSVPCERVIRQPINTSSVQSSTTCTVPRSQERRIQVIHGVSDLKQPQAHSDVKRQGGVGSTQEVCKGPNAVSTYFSASHTISCSRPPTIGVPISSPDRPAALIQQPQKLCADAPVRRNKKHSGVDSGSSCGAAYTQPDYNRTALVDAADHSALPTNVLVTRESHEAYSALQGGEVRHQMPYKSLAHRGRIPLTGGNPTNRIVNGEIDVEDNDVALQAAIAQSLVDM